MPTSAGADVQQRKGIIASIHKRAGEDGMQSTGPSTKKRKRSPSSLLTVVLCWSPPLMNPDLPCLLPASADLWCYFPTRSHRKLMSTRKTVYMHKWSVLDRSGSYGSHKIYPAHLYASFLSLHNIFYFNYVHVQRVCTMPSPPPILESLGMRPQGKWLTDEYIHLAWVCWEPSSPVQSNLLPEHDCFHKALQIHLLQATIEWHPALLDRKLLFMTANMVANSTPPSVTSLLAFRWWVRWSRISQSPKDSRSLWLWSLHNSICTPCRIGGWSTKCFLWAVSDVSSSPWMLPEVRTIPTQGKSKRFKESVIVESA